MAIQVKQEFPHCERCGIMVHERRRRIEAEPEPAPGAPAGATGAGAETAGATAAPATAPTAAVRRDPLVYCSEICRDEYVAMHGLADRGRWVTGLTGATAGIGRRR